MLTNIHLFQFKRFKDELIEFFPLTLLTGINGMGKSSVIEALLALRQSFDRGELQNNKKLVIEDKLVTKSLAKLHTLLKVSTKPSLSVIFCSG